MSNLPVNLAIVIAILLIWLAFVIQSATRAKADTLVTIASEVIVIVDGDTFKIGKDKVRLYGIDAFELSQVGGPAAKERLAALVKSSPLVTCRVRSTDKYGRAIATCFSLTGLDLGQQLVREGSAFAYIDYSDKYVPDQEFAAKHELGAWAGGKVPVLPWLYRKQRHARSRL